VHINGIESFWVTPKAAESAIILLSYSCEHINQMTGLAVLYFLIAAGIQWFLGRYTAATIALSSVPLLLFFMCQIYRHALMSMVRRTGTRYGAFKTSDNRAAPKPIRCAFFALYWFSVVQVGSSIWLVIDATLAGGIVIVAKAVAIIFIYVPANFFWVHRYAEDPRDQK